MSGMEKDANLLRAEAEARVARRPLKLVEPQPGEDLLHELLHELRVHQIELEMQNDELRRAQIIIEESRDRYVDLYEFSPVGYLTLNREGVITEGNLTCSTLLEMERKKLLNRRFDSFVSHRERERWNHIFLHLLQDYELRVCELSLKRGDGSTMHARLDCRHIKNEEVSSVRVAITDITESKLREGETSIAAIAFQSQNGIMITDAQGIILRINAAFTHLTGYSAEEAIGHTPALLKSARQDDQFYQHMWRTKQEKGYWQGEIWNKRKNGRISADKLNIKAIVSSEGNTTHYLGTFTDIPAD